MQSGLGLMPNIRTPPRLPSKTVEPELNFRKHVAHPMPCLLSRVNVRRQLVCRAKASLNLKHPSRFPVKLAGERRQTHRLRAHPQKAFIKIVSAAPAPKATNKPAQVRRTLFRVLSLMSLAADVMPSCTSGNSSRKCTLISANRD